LILRAIELSIAAPKKLLPHQYAIKNPNSISQSPWFRRRLLIQQPNHHIASLDISNAFGSVSPNYLAEQLSKLRNPRLIAYNSLYAHVIPTTVSNDDIYLISTGVF
jgi:hypothetical protein